MTNPSEALRSNFIPSSNLWSYIILTISILSIVFRVRGKREERGEREGMGGRGVFEKAEAAWLLGGEGMENSQLFYQCVWKPVSTVVKSLVSICIFTKR